MNVEQIEEIAKRIQEYVICAVSEMHYRDVIAGIESILKEYTTPVDIREKTIDECIGKIQVVDKSPYLPAELNGIDYCISMLKGMKEKPLS